MTYRILLIGGGTGGHIYPLIAVAREFQKAANKKNLNLKLMAVAESNKWKGEFESQDIRFKRIFSPKFKRVEGGKIDLFAFLKLPLALLQGLWFIFLFMPDAVFSKGGFVSVIPSLVAKLYFIPLFIHETDAVPGKVNRILSKFSEKVFISFQSNTVYFKNKNTIVSGNPIRESLLKGDKAEAGRYFNLNSTKKTILFLTGMQGVSFINRLVIDSLVQLSKEFQIIHQTGVNNFESVKKETENIKKEGGYSYGQDIEKNYRIFSFLSEEELASAYALCDIVVSRSGSNIFEIAYLGKPAIVIPYPYSAGDHQKANALEFAKFGGVILEEENLKPSILIDQIEYLLKPENYSLISQKIKQFAKPDAAKTIAEQILNYVVR